MLKTSGYLVSTVSVLLLAIVAWKGAKDDPLLTALLILGALTSVTGMALRWVAFLREEKPSRSSAPDRADRATREGPAPSPPHRAPEGFARQASRR